MSFRLLLLLLLLMQRMQAKCAGCSWLSTAANCCCLAEVEPQPNNAANAAYNYRFPVPQDEATRETGSLCCRHSCTCLAAAEPQPADAHPLPGPIVFKPATPAEPFNNLYYKVEVPGVLTAIFLTSYAWNQTMQPTEQQYKWAQQQLEKVCVSVWGGPLWRRARP